VAWCPGCGNFAIRDAIADALQSLSIRPQELVITSGIGQAAKMPQYLTCHYFNGLHGRALPLATAVKSVNPELTVIAEGGDGDMYGEGGNHFLHSIRRNPNVTHIVHNNMIYGLTKGQASPTSARGLQTPVQVDGVILEPFNPLAVALSAGATFVARCFSGESEHLVRVLKEAIQHPGYALVDVFQPCVSFNKVNTYAWYRDHTYLLEEDGTDDLQEAFRLSQQQDPFPLGILYRSEGKPTYTQNANVYQDDKAPLYRRKRDMQAVQNLIDHP